MVILAASLAGASGASVCDLTQCQCLLSLWGTEVACQCEEHEVSSSSITEPESSAVRRLCMEPNGARASKSTRNNSWHLLHFLLMLLEGLSSVQAVHEK